MLIAEDLVMLLYDDETGKPRADGTRLDVALAGAMLLELSMRGQVSVSDGSGPLKSGRLMVSATEPTGDALLDRYLAALARYDGKKPAQSLNRLKKGLRAELLARLAEQGILRADRSRVLGVFPVTRWPAVDSTHEAALRQRLHDVLVVGVEPDPHTAALTSLLTAIDALVKVVPAEDRRALKRRGKEIAEGEWAAAAVRKAVQEVNAATMAAISAAAAAGAAGSS